MEQKCTIELLEDLPKMSRGMLLDVLGDRVAYMPRKMLEALATTAVLVTAKAPPFSPMLAKDQTPESLETWRVGMSIIPSAGQRRELNRIAGYNRTDEEYWCMQTAFLYGMMEGKREERRKRHGNDNDSDGCGAGLRHE